MPWISLSSERHRLRESAAYTISREREGKKTRSYSHLPTVSAFVSGDQKLISEAIQRCRELLPKTKAEAEPPPPGLLQHVLPIVIAAAYEGFDPTRVFEIIADAADYPQAEGVLQSLVRRIVGGKKEKTPAKKSREAATDKEWIDVVFDGPPDQALDLALTPDHSRWGTMAMFTMPLAYLLSQDFNPWRERFLALMMLGPFGPAKSEIVYENDVVSDDLDVTADDGRTRWHVGFDVLRLRDDDLDVYHYVGANATAADVKKVIPAVLTRGEKAWARLENAMGPAAWKRVEKTMKANCTHTIVYRKSRKPLADRWLEDTAAEFQVRLQAADVNAV